MDALTLKVNLDCLRKDSQAIINAKVGEANGRKVVFTLYEGRTAFFVPAGVSVIFRAQKPDGTILYNNCVIDDGKVEYTITSQTVAMAGVYACELQIVSDGRIIYSPYVTLNVMDNLYADTEVESSNEFTELENALNKIPPLEVIYSKYTKPEGGIPKSDLAQDVQNSLNKANTALQEHQSLAAYRTASEQDIIDSTKQDKLTAGENITIADDGKTISAKGIGVLEVTLTTQNGVSTADKTFDQVKAAAESGAPVLKVHSDGALLWFFLLDKSPTEIDFVGLVDEQIIAYLTAKQDGTWETTIAARVTAEMLSSLNDKIGNIGQLTTTDKTNLVAAVNEVKHTVDSKQDKLIAGDNITIAADGKTISATGGGSSYDDTELRQRIGDIEAKESTWDAKSNFSGSYNDLTDKPTIPDSVTEGTVSGWGFTKNTGTYSKPTDGIPKADLANDVQDSLSKAETALQSVSTDNIDALAVTNAKIANGAVSTGKIARGAVTEEKISTALLDKIDGMQPKTITDTAGYYTTDTVEGALAEIGGTLDGLEAAINTIRGIS